MNINDWIKLPIYLQIVLGGGFIAYMIAMHGRRKDEKAVDLFFGVIAFSLPGLFLWMALKETNASDLISGLLVVPFGAVMGALWRKWLHKMFYGLLYKANISTDEGYKTTWQRIIQDVDISSNQVWVTLKSGKTLGCNNVGEFVNAAIPVWSMDDEGNIAIYVTHIDGEPVETTLRDKDWGDLITYIPASEVYTVDFRYKKA